MGMPRSDFFQVGPCVLSYVDGLFNPQTNDSGKESYGATIIFTEQILAAISPVVEQIGRQAFPSDWDVRDMAGVFKCKRPFHHITEKNNYAEQQANFAPGYLYYCAISTLYAPSLFDIGSDQKMQGNNVNPATGVKPYYGGIWVNVSVNVYSWNFPKGGQGVSIGIQAVSKIGDGPQLIEVGAVDAQKLFGQMSTALPQGAPAPGYPQQGAPAPAYPVQGQQAPAYAQQPAAAPAPAGQAPAYGQQPAAAPAPAGQAPAYGQQPAAAPAPAGQAPAYGQAPAGPAPGQAPAQGYGQPQGAPQGQQAPVYAPPATMAPGVEPAPPMGQPAAGPAQEQAQPNFMGGVQPVTGQQIPPIQG